MYPSNTFLEGGAKTVRLVCRFHRMKCRGHFLGLHLFGWNSAKTDATSSPDVPRRDYICSGRSSALMRKEVESDRDWMGRVFLFELVSLLMIAVFEAVTLAPTHSVLDFDDFC